VGIGITWLFLSEEGVTQRMAAKSSGKTGEWKESGREAAERTRGKLQEASHAFSERMHRAGERLHEVGDRARETRGRVSGNISNVADTVRQNPLPAVMAGLGLGWLFMSASGRTATAAERAGEWREAGGGMASRAREKFQETSHTMSERFQEKSHSMKERFQEKTQPMSERLHQTGEKARSARDKLTEQVHVVRERAQQVRGGYRQMREERPMLLVLMGTAIGVLLGTLLPITRREEEVLGGTGAEVRARAREMLHEGVEKAGQVTSAAAQAAKEEAERQMH
jgi:ElaB/YqjD/DUF883 family membrane-anchored ribosome-binding protein